MALGCGGGVGSDFGGTAGDLSTVLDLMLSGEKGGVGATGRGVEPLESVEVTIARSGVIRL